MQQLTVNNTLTAKHLGWVLVAMALTFVPHVTHLPLWVSALAGSVALWRYVAHLRGWGLPPMLIRSVLVAVSFSGVFAQYRTVNGIEAGSALLCVMAVMKLTETRSQRDLVVLIYIAYFLIAAQFLYEQTVWILVWAAPAVWLLSATLLQVTHQGRVLDLRPALAMSGRMLLHALPIMLALFLLFPRMQGSFWAIEAPPKRGLMGLSDKLELGSISELITSDEVAFRVRFEDEVPARRDRYWRGPVLDHFDGRTWTPGATAQSPGETPDVQHREAGIAYELTLEPQKNRFIFALETPDPLAVLGADAMLTQDYQILARRDLTDRNRLRLISYPNAKTDYISGPLRKRALALPPGNPRTVALARRIRDEGDRDAARIIERALAMFREQEFYYTLRPGQLTGNRIDEFLFETRRGFCEHYASAFTFMMRAAGIPARIVTGYQGGEINPSMLLGGHMTVRQSDAHAWSEVWLDGQGWVRVDPTGYVAPERIESGIGEALPDFQTGFSRHALLNGIRHTWDGVNNAWNDWVLGYGPARQDSLMRALGVQDPNAYKLVALLGVSMVLIAGSLYILLEWRGRPPAPSPAARIYQRFCRRLARRRLERAPHESPRDFARRVSEQMPQVAEEVHSITELYLAVRYLPGRNDDQLNELRQRVARLQFNSRGGPLTT
jgi:transglutaminase-like putative cysteine protease